MKVEILHVRDPDGGCSHDVYIDGEIQTDCVVEDVDAGRGYTREDWEESTQWVQDSAYSEGFKKAVLASREDPPGGKFIEED